MKSVGKFLEIAGNPLPSGVIHCVPCNQQTPSSVSPTSIKNVLMVCIIDLRCRRRNGHDYCNHHRRV